MLRLAYFSPLSPIRSGISAYSEELLPCLARHAEIELFVDDYTPDNPAIVKLFPIHDQSVYPPVRWTYDMVIYHLGNNPYHEGIYRVCLQYPGIAVLHDYVLHGLAGGITLARGDKAGYVREMGYCDGLVGSQRAWRIANEREAVNGHSYPLNKRVLDLSLGVIVHSDYVRRLVLQANPQARVGKVNMGVPLPELAPQSKMLARQALGLDPGGLLFASFGFITPVKRTEVVLLAFKRLLEDYPTARYFVVGQMEPDYELADTIRLLGLEEKVTVTGYVPRDTYRKMMCAADVAINLRYPTAGETSSSVLRLLALGLPTIVSDVGWFAELPDDCCLKAKPDEKEERAVWQQMAFLAGNEEMRQDLGKRARDYVSRNHSLGGAAHGYIEFIRSVLEGLT